ncbi:50S ribosomal protein L18e [archaeon]|nr:50S ribosomal protein L18e [archaeon]
MKRKTKHQTLELIKLIRELKKASTKNKVNIWKRVASDLEKPTRIRRKVNIYKINKFTKEGEAAVIPGKVLSLGELAKPLTIAAYQFSDKAKEKINQKGKAISISELINKNPKGSKVRIIG